MMDFPIYECKEVLSQEQMVAVIGAAPEKTFLTEIYSYMTMKG